MFIVAGPGGAGKGTVAAALVARDGRLWLSRSWTTRRRRPGEAEDAYEFVDRSTFEKAVDAGRFLEHAQFMGNLYGTPLPAPPPGQDVLLEIDFQGVEQVKAKVPEAVVVLLVPPSTEVQAQRLRSRGDDEGAVRERLELGAAEVAHLRDLAEHVVVNDDVDRAVDELLGILERHRAAV